jgi:protein YIPF1/2
VCYTQAHQWTYDFRMLTAAGGIVFGFLVGASVILWACLQYVSVAVPLRKLLCLYGYSLTIFVPAAVP